MAMQNEISANGPRNGVSFARMENELGVIMFLDVLHSGNDVTVNMEGTVLC
jgi:hypothetical protein